MKLARVEPGKGFFQFVIIKKCVIVKMAEPFRAESGEDIQLLLLFTAQGFPKILKKLIPEFSHESHAIQINHNYDYKERHNNLHSQRDIALYKLSHEIYFS